MAQKKNINTRTVSANDAKVAISRCFDTKRPVFLWGPPGIGKSELIEQLAKEKNGHMIDMRMSLIEPTDLKGIPYFNPEQGNMKWAPPIDLPTEELASQYDIVVLFLDEMNSAPPSVQAAGYQLILNRRVGEYQLPDNVVIVAAGNRESDKGVTYRMPAPLANRFVHLEMKVDYESWFEWAVGNKIHPDVTGYITYAKQDLFNFEPTANERAFATPRSWTFVSDLISDDSLPHSTMVDLVSGTIGEGTAIKFLAHRKIAADLPNPEDILSGEVTKMKSKEISAMYSLVISMCYTLKEYYDNIDEDNAEEERKTFYEMADYFFTFMMDNFSTELVVMGSAVAMKNYQLPLSPAHLKSFDRFHDNYGKYIMNAVKS